MSSLLALLDESRGELQVMLLPWWIAAAIGAKTRAVILSAQTMVKNHHRHPDLQLVEYALLPKLNGASKEALVIQDHERACVIIHAEGRCYLVALKATRSGETIFATSFHRLDDPQEIHRKLRRGRLLASPPD